MGFYQQFVNRIVPINDEIDFHSTPSSIGWNRFATKSLFTVSTSNPTNNVVLSKSTYAMFPMAKHLLNSIPWTDSVKSFTVHLIKFNTDVFDTWNVLSVHSMDSSHCFLNHPNDEKVQMKWKLMYALVGRSIRITLKFFRISKQRKALLWNYFSNAWCVPPEFPQGIPFRKLFHESGARWNMRVMTMEYSL